MESRTCVHCGYKFKLSESTQKLFKDKNFKEPNHCITCLRKRRTEAYRFECENCNSIKILDGLEYENHLFYNYECDCGHVIVERKGDVYNEINASSNASLKVNSIPY